MQDRFKLRVYCKSEKKMMLFNNPTLIDGDILQGGLLFKNYDHKITNCREVLPEDLILLQCTGLKDKNGKLIYEGDILNYKFDEIGEQLAVVNFNKKYASFTLIPLYNFQYINMDEGEIIGNIYKNPELLEVKE